MVDEWTSVETSALVDWCARTGFEDLPPTVTTSSKRLLLDYVGVTLGGADHDASRFAAEGVRQLGGNPQATLIGFADRSSMVNAAMVNGVSSHVLDFDDTHIPTILHPTGPIASAGMAIAEARGRSGCELIRAHAVALEAASRVALAISPEHHEAGWHMSGTAGTIGAAVGAGLLLELSPAQLLAALSMAATQAAGHREQFGSMTKSFHVGKSAANGVLAALLAERGFTAAADPLQGRRGMFSVMASDGHPAFLADEQGSRWEIFRVGIKPYSCGVVTHPPIDAVRRLSADHGIRAEEVESVDLFVNPMVVDLTGQAEPRTGLEGKFSVVFCAAIAMLEGAAGPRQFTDEAVRRAEVVELRRRIRPIPDEAVHHACAKAVALLRDGREVVVDVEAATGTPENPMSDEALAAKFLDLVEPVVGRERADALISEMRSLERVADLGKISEQLVAPEPV